MPKLSTHPIHLGQGATAIEQPVFTGMPWYAGYLDRHGADGHDGRLVTMHTFQTPWNMWEMHPDGSEVVVCTTGMFILIQEMDGKHVPVTLQPGEYAINAPGVWHTADIHQLSTALFITSGIGTQHRDR